jgi:broad-specificity NMP kinase
LAFLVLIYGAPLVGKTAVAWELARMLGGKSAVVSLDQLLGGSIAVGDEDAEAELEMAHTQLRLLVANYLKNRYHVVVEGPFVFEREGRLLSFERDIDEVAALMRNLAQRTMIVRLEASEGTLRERALASGRTAEIDAALRVRTALKGRYGERVLSFDTDSMRPEEIAEAVRDALTREII